MRYSNINYPFSLKKNEKCEYIIDSDETVQLLDNDQSKQSEI